MEILAVSIVIAAVALAVAIIVVRRPQAPTHDGLQERIQQLNESSNQLQALLGEQLHKQSESLHKHLAENATSTHKNLSDLKERLAVIDSAQKNITDLSQQMVGLQDILSNKSARGVFGEVQLREIIEAVLPPSAYSFQTTLSTGKRADCVLKLPNPPGDIVVDSKFPLENYETYLSAESRDEQLAAAKLFSTDVLKHVTDIADKYIIPGETAESALMFLPSESIYAELHASFPDVIQKSFRKKVWIVSPTTMMATLNTIRGILRDVQVREQAAMIQKELLHLMEDVTRLDTRVGKLQTHFDQASRDIADIRTSSDKITKRADNIQNIEVETPQKLDAPTDLPADGPANSNAKKMTAG